MTSLERRTSDTDPQAERKTESLRDHEPVVRPEVVALIRMLLKEPPPSHDFTTCPICHRYDITSI
jgi:hypothetical protein